MGAIPNKQQTAIKMEILGFINNNLPFRLIPQHTRIIDVDRLAVSEEGDDDTQANSRLSGRDGHDHKNKQLARNVAVITRERNECQVYGIEHQLDAHKHTDSVALKNNADRADGEQYS
jgi:hypothetical protein